MSVATTQELTELLERVRRAEGPDREVDAGLMALNHFREDRFIGGYYDDGEQALDNVWVDRETNAWRSTAPHNYTASIDEAVGLVERMLPGTEIDLHINNPQTDWQTAIVRTRPLEKVAGECATIPLAILAALLSALIAQQEQDSLRKTQTT